MINMKIPRRHFLKLAGAAVALPGAARGDDRLQDLLLQQMQSRGLPGLAVSVTVSGRLIAARALGFADLARHKRASARTVFQLASVTKQFVASAVMLLVQDGKLSTDAPLTEVLDNVPDTWNGVRVRHLLTHTSGIEDYLAAVPSTYDLNADPGLRALVRTMPLEFQPGDQWQYSNSNYLLLGHLIERISGAPYDRFLGARVFRPLGMASTHRRVPGDPAMAVGYNLGANGSAPTPARFLPPALWDNADGGLVSTVEDMAKWDHALSAGTIVSARSLEEMYRRTTLNDGRVQDYGYGVVVNVIGAHRVVGHGGSRPGVATNFTRWPDDGVSVTVLCNAQLGSNDPYEIARSIARLYAPAVP